MSNKGKTVFLSHIFDEAVSFASKNLPESSNYHVNTSGSLKAQGSLANSGYVTTNTITTTAPEQNYGYKSWPGYEYYQPTWLWIDILKDFKSTYTLSYIPDSPVSNYSINNDGTSIIEVAITGFSKDEISIDRDDLKLIIKGTKKEKDEKDERKYFYKKISEANFTLEFEGSTKWDYDQIDTNIADGKLIVMIPMKEECKPIKKSIPIK